MLRAPGFALGVLFAVNTLNFYDRQVLGALTEPIRHEWGLDDFGSGALYVSFTLFYAVAGVPIGRLADIYPRRVILALGVFLWSILTAACGLAGGYWTLFVCRLGVGVGEAACAPAAASLVGDLYRAERRGRALSIFMAGLPAGIALSYLVSGRVAAAFSWRAAFFVAGLPGLLLAALALVLPEPARGAAEASSRNAGDPARVTPEKDTGAVRTLLATPTFLWIVASGALHNFNMYALGVFLVSYLVRWHGLSLASANDGATLIAGVGGAVGLFAGGIAADLALRRWRRGRLFVATGGAVAAVPLLLLALAAPRGQVAAFSLALGASVALTYAYYSGVYATIQDLVEPRRRGTAMALYFFAMYTLGGALGPLATGALSDHLTRRAAAAAAVEASPGRVDAPAANAAPAAAQSLEPYRAEGLRQAMHVLPGVCAALAIVLYAASRTLPRDLDRRAKRSTAPS